MSNWCYGLVRQKNKKIRVWEIFFLKINKKQVIFGTPAHFWWVLKDINILIKDLLSQKKYFKRFWTEEELEKGSKTAKKVLK